MDTESYRGTTVRLSRSFYTKVLAPSRLWRSTYANTVNLRRTAHRYWRFTFGSFIKSFPPWSEVRCHPPRRGPILRQTFQTIVAEIIDNAEAER